MSFWRNFGQLVDEFTNDVYADGMKEGAETQAKIKAAMETAQEMGMHELEEKFINESDKYVKAGYAQVLSERRR